MLISNATLVQLGAESQVLEGQAIVIDHDKISAIGPEKALRAWYPDQEVLDAKGQIVMPGNICAHTHFYGAFARGMGIPGPAPKDFPEILKKLWWPLDKSLDPQAVKYSSLVMLMDAIRNGTTTLIDHHASPNAISGSLDEIASAVDLSGLRAVLCYEVTDRDGVGFAKSGIEENVRFLNRVKGGPLAGGRVAATFGLHASLTLSDETLDACRSAALPDTGFHIHVAEHEADEYDSIARTGKRVVDRLKDHDLLGPKTIVAHAIHVDAQEIYHLAETNTWVTHQPRSNMNNGVGVAAIESMIRAGVKVCLGTDGFPHNMWEELRFAYMLQKVHHRDPRRMPGDVLLDIATTNNANLAGKFFPDAPLGVLTEGAFADLIFVNYLPHTPLNAENLPWQIIYGFQERMITTTIVAGKVLMLDGVLLTLDEKEITARARELAPKVWARYQKYAAAK